MNDGPSDRSATDGLHPQPSTPRVNSGSPDGRPSSPGEPAFSSEADAVFEVLKARISRLCDAGSDPDDIRERLLGAGRSKTP